MYYDYYYKIDGELKRYTSLTELSNDEVSNIFGSSKKVVILEPIVFEREVGTKKIEKIHVGYLGFIE